MIGSRGPWGVALVWALALASACAKKPVAPSPSPEEQARLAEEKALVAAWCSDFDKSIREFRWKIDPCGGLEWKVSGKSVQGRALVYTEFGNPSSTNVTLVLAGVHGDEITPQYLGVKLARWLVERRNELTDKRIIVAPVVNPDGFFEKRRTRVNANGVDVNRNFATHDWNARALQAWKARYKSDPRRFPGSTASSEPETRFQVELIEKFRPQKILSIHSPLNFIDYDGPTALSLARFPREYVRECLKLRKNMKAISGGFFPGSLGNFSGQEKGIPTLTLELPTADPGKAERYWISFSRGIHTMIDFIMPAVDSAALSARERG